jgi:hypothetical protein
MFFVYKKTRLSQPKCPLKNKGQSKKTPYSKNEIGCYSKF